MCRRGDVLFVAVTRLSRPRGCRGHAIVAVARSSRPRESRASRPHALLRQCVFSPHLLCQVWMWRGASGTRCCPLCLNIVSVASGLSGLDPSLVSIACADFKRLVPTTHAGIVRTLRRLEGLRGSMSKANFEKEQMICGWCDPRGSLLLDPALASHVDVVRHLCFDWAHIFLVNGIFNVHMGLFMQALRGSRIEYQEVAAYARQWQWPKRLQSKQAVGITALENPRVKSSVSSGVWHADASEGLSLCPVLASFVRHELLDKGVAVDHCRVFLLLCVVVDLLLCVPRGCVIADELHDAILAHHRGFVDTYGEGAVVPKFHYAVHLPEFLRRFGMLPSCLLHERKHRVAKRYLADRRNTSADIGSGALRDITVHHLEFLGDDRRFDSTCCLLGPRNAAGHALEWLRSQFSGPSQYQVASSARCARREVCFVDDLVSVVEPGRPLWMGKAILFFARTSGQQSFAVLRAFRCVKCNGWVATDDIKVVDIQLLTGSAIYRQGDQNVVHVIRPRGFTMRG